MRAPGLHSRDARIAHSATIVLSHYILWFYARSLLRDESTLLSQARSVLHQRRRQTSRLNTNFTERAFSSPIYTIQPCNRLDNRLYRLNGVSHGAWNALQLKICAPSMLDPAKFRQQLNAHYFASAFNVMWLPDCSFSLCVFKIVDRLL